MRVAVLGAGGTIGPALVRDLSESDEFTEIAALDMDGARARAVAEEHGGGKASGAAVDATQREALVLALEGCSLLVNAASYRINIAAMDAALAAGCGYVDLGGLYHLTARQLELHDAFLERGVLAVLGAGAGPGKTNVMAMHAAAQLAEVHTIRCSSAGHDETPPDGLAPPYALATLLDELTEPPMVFRDGHAEPIPPLTDGGEIEFPAPVGRRGSINTLHSEVLTLPESLGARASDFRLSLTPGVHAALLRLLDLPAEERTRVPTQPPSARTWSAQHVQVTGTSGADEVAVTVTSLTPPHERWGLGGGIVSTASVAAATARLYARGLLHAAGAFPPERILTPELLFGELARVGTTFQTTTTEVANA